MSFKDWYDADYYSVVMDEFYCPKCNQVIIAFDDLRILLVEKFNLNISNKQENLIYQRKMKIIPSKEDNHAT